MTITKAQARLLIEVSENEFCGTAEITISKGWSGHSIRTVNALSTSGLIINKGVGQYGNSRRIQLTRDGRKKMFLAKFSKNSEGFNELIALFDESIAYETANIEEIKTSGNQERLELLSAYEGDLVELTAVYDAFVKRDWDKASDLQFDLDTMVREQIPYKIYSMLESF